MAVTESLCNSPDSMLTKAIIMMAAILTTGGHQVYKPVTMEGSTNFSLVGMSQRFKRFNGSTRAGGLNHTLGIAVCLRPSTVFARSSH